MYAITDFFGDHRFLSNFFPSEIEVEGKKYPTVEHAYQAAKTQDPEWREAIRNASTAKEAKNLGRKCPPRKEWDDLKIPTMKDLLKRKFQDKKLAKKLVETHPKELVEGNWWGDTFWGVCHGKGKNWLGKLLMEVREELMEVK